MSFYSKIYSIQNIKVKIKHIPNVECFVASFTVLGLEVNVTEDYVIIPFDYNHEHVARLIEHSLAATYALNKPFDLGIEIKNP